MDHRAIDTKRNLVRFSAVLIAAFTLITASALAQGVHPAYLHALTDFRTVRAHLDVPDAGPLRDLEVRAIREIDGAIEAIKRAAIDDGKNLNDHPPIDTRLDWPGCLHQARELLGKAHSDVAGEEDDRFAHGSQHPALGHIEAARRHVDEAIQVVATPR